MDGYCRESLTLGGGADYSLVVGDEHDIHLRRPLGYATLIGGLASDPGDQLGGQIQGREVVTWASQVHLERLEVASEPGRTPPG